MSASKLQSASPFYQYQEDEAAQFPVDELNFELDNGLFEAEEVPPTQSGVLPSLKELETSARGLSYNPMQHAKQAMTQKM